MKKACVIGWPIAHSRSPLIHGYWLRHYGIEGSYERIAVSPDAVATFLRSLRGGEFVGCNVTLPYKETVLAFVDRLTPEASGAGSVNTIFREGASLVGTSTDGSGFADSVVASVQGFAWGGKKVLVLGAGGSARAIVASLLQRSVGSVSLWNRTSARAHSLSGHFSGVVAVLQWDQIAQSANESDVIINTTSAGLAEGQPLEFPFGEVSGSKVVSDIVYVPLFTPFLREAEARGHQVVPGLGMLLHQAVLGFERWFGRRPEVTRELYELVARDIEAGIGN